MKPRHCHIYKFSEELETEADSACLMLRHKITLAQYKLI